MAVSSERWVIWAAVKAIWADDKVSIGFAAELAVDTALLKVLALTVWLAERFERINMPTTSNNKKLPAISPYRTSFRFDFWLSWRTGLDKASTTS